MSLITIRTLKDVNINSFYTRYPFSALDGFTYTKIIYIATDWKVSNT